MNDEYTCFTGGLTANLRLAWGLPFPWFLGEERRAREGGRARGEVGRADPEPRDEAATLPRRGLGARGGHFVGT